MGYVDLLSQKQSSTFTAGDGINAPITVVQNTNSFAGNGNPGFFNFVGAVGTESPGSATPQPFLRSAGYDLAYSTGAYGLLYLISFSLNGAPQSNVSSFASTNVGVQTTPAYIPVIQNLSCFPGDTLVATPSGDRRIEELKIGDKIYSADLILNKIFENEIEQIEITNPVIDYVILNEKLTATGNHPMWVNGVEWVPADKIQIGDYLINKDKQKVWIFSAVREPLSFRATDTGIPRCDDKVYNLRMKHKVAPNYFAEGLLVHNKCPFLYAYDTMKAMPWIYQNTFLTGLDSPDKKAVQRRPLRTFTNEFYIRELEPEESYIDDLALIAIDSDGVETKLSWVNKPDNQLVTKQKDIVFVEFEKLPQKELKELWVEAVGYYRSLE